MYVSDVGVDDLKIYGIMEPYLIVLGSAIIVFLLLYLYMRIVERSENNSNTEEEDETSETRPVHMNLDYQSLSGLYDRRGRRESNFEDRLNSRYGQEGGYAEEQEMAEMHLS